MPVQGMVDRAWSWTRSEVRPILTSGYDWFLHGKIKCRRERGLNGWDGSVYASDFRCLTTANSWQGCQLSASCQVDDVCQVPRLYGYTHGGNCSSYPLKFCQVFKIHCCSRNHCSLWWDDEATKISNILTWCWYIVAVWALAWKGRWCNL